MASSRPTVIADLLTSRPASVVLVALALVAAPAIDVFVLGSGHLISSLYGLPVLIAAPHWKPRRVAVLAAVAVGLHVAVGLLQRDDPELGLLYTVSLLMISGLGILVSMQREQIQRRAREAEVARQQLQTFMSMVAHELAAPVTGVLGQAQFGLRTAHGRERRSLRIIEAEARQLARLVEDLRDAARIGAGSFEIAPAPLELAELVETVVARWREATPTHTIALHAPDRLVVHGDRHRLVQVLDNLISNAIKYSPRETEVDVSVNLDGDRVVLTVSDRGPGIPAEARAELFRPFSRLTGTAGVPGTGLGLFISHAIVEAHGGAIEVTDAATGGSAFVVQLPPASAEPVGATAETSPA